MVHVFCILLSKKCCHRQISTQRFCIQNNFSEVTNKLFIKFLTAQPDELIPQEVVFEMAFGVFFLFNPTTHQRLQS
jgi:hypothetical protein